MSTPPTLPPLLVEHPNGTRTFADRALADDLAALLKRTPPDAAGLNFGLGVTGDPGSPPVMESWIAIKTANGWSVSGALKAEWKGSWAFGIAGGKSF